MLAEFIATHRDEIISRCRGKVLARTLPPPTKTEIDHGVPLFLDQLRSALRRGQSSSAEIADTAVLHGHDLLRQGFTVSQVVHDYGDVCQSITELAVERNAAITTEDFRVLNGCLDDAIAGADTQYGSERNQSTIDGGTLHENERVGFLVHELRNLVQTAIVAFDVLKTGNVGIGGSTGRALYRSLTGARDLLIRSIAAVRLANGVQNHEQFSVSEFIDELAPGAALVAQAAGITLAVRPIDPAIEVRADRQVLASAVMNLLQNGFKFTRPHTSVILHVGASTERVFIEIEDQCGGLPSGDSADLFRAFEQRSANRSGLGLGLAFSRSAVEASDGRIYAHNRPGVGCTFTIDLPRVAMVEPV